MLPILTGLSFFCDLVGITSLVTTNHQPQSLNNVSEQTPKAQVMLATQFRD